MIELLLTRYCKNNNIKYKQGLNEVLAPFMYLMEESQRAAHSRKEEPRVDLKFVYNSFSGFINRYLTNFYMEEEFYSLQTALAFLTLLHRYHDPQVSLFLISSQITPEMYAVPWFLTFFAK
jgi:Rab-GTPase-TBC domain